MRKKNKKQDQDMDAVDSASESPEEILESTDEVAAKAAEQEEKDPAEEIAELRDRLQRTTAEFMNFRKQTEKRQKDARLFVRRDVFEQILPIVDNFGSAMKALDQGQDAKNVLIGVKMIHEMLEKLLTDNGIKPIVAVDKPFDPKMHEAVSQEEKEDVEPNVVLGEVARGYTMNDIVLRHARVVVSVAPKSEEDSSDDNSTGEDQ